MLKSHSTHKKAGVFHLHTYNLTTNEKQNNPDMYKKGDKVFTEGWSCHKNKNYNPESKAEP